MKGILMTLFALSFGIVVTSCSMESSVDMPDIGPARTATIVLTPAAVVARAGGMPEDDRIKSFRILIFESSGAKKMVYNKVFDMSSATNPITLTLHLNTYDFVFVANEEVDLRLQGVLASLPSTTLITSLESEYFSSASFNEIGNIPMCGVAKSVEIVSDGKLTVGGTTLTGNWDISAYLKRLGIRLDLTLKASAGLGHKFLGLEISNLPDKVYLFETRMSGTAIYNGGSYESAPRNVVFDPGSGYVNETTGYTWTKKRLILPSNVFLSKTSSSYAVRLSARMDGSSNRTATLGYNESAPDYTAPRNKHFTLIGTLSDNIVFYVAVDQWNYSNVDI